MDSLSQMALGSAIADVGLGRRIGRRALLLGAALGTLPDLDVLVRYADAVDSFTKHRGFSHSLFVLTAASPLLALLARRLLAGPPPDAPAAASRVAVQVPFALWWLTVWAVLITHALLDAFTTYGTQLFWPLPVPPVAIGSIFIIDPLYTLPLVVAVLFAWFRRGPSRRGAHVWGLGLSSAWLLMTLVLQQVARHEATVALERDGVTAERVLALPFPFGVLWRVIALEGDTVHVGWVSLADRDDALSFAAEPRGLDALGAARGLPAVERLDWFTQGFVGARRQGDELVLTDLRIGVNEAPIFAFAVADIDGERYVPQIARAIDPTLDATALGALVRRVGDASVMLDTALLAGSLPPAGTVSGGSP